MATYKGTGTINGVSGYSFNITVADGDVLGDNAVDGFRIKIWSTQAGETSSGIVYDNKAGDDGTLTQGNTQPIEGGSIVIHK